MVREMNEGQRKWVKLPQGTAPRAARKDSTQQRSESCGLNTGNAKHTDKVTP